MYKNKETGATLSTEAMQAAADRNGKSWIAGVVIH